MVEAWRTFHSGDVPPRLVRPTRTALRELSVRVDSREREKVRPASIDVSYATNDLELRYQPVVDIDLIRFELWARRTIVDASAGSIGGVRSDQVTLEWIRDRIALTMDPVTRTRIDTLVGGLGAAAADGDLGAARSVSVELHRVVNGVIAN